MNGPAYVRYASPAGKWLLAVTVLGSSIAFLEATVVNVALPAIGEDLGADVAGLQWTINGYLLTLASLILLGGALGDRYGRRRIFELGVVWFTAASVLCAVAPSVEFLVFARVLQGVGGALLTPGSLALIDASFHPDDRGRAIGAWSALGGISAAIGPLVGGYLVESVTWRAIFFINIPLGLFVVCGRPPACSREPRPDRHRAAGRDRLGSGHRRPGRNHVRLHPGLRARDRRRGGGGGPPVIGIAAAVAFVMVERRSAHPMLPLEIFAIAPVHQREPGHLHRLRGPRRGVLPARGVPAGRPRLLPDRRGSGLATGHGHHARPVGADGGTGAADRAPPSAHGRPIADRGGNAADDPDRHRRHLCQRGAAGHPGVRPGPVDGRCPR